MPHGNAHVGGFQCRRIVHAIAGHRHHGAALIISALIATVIPAIIANISAALQRLHQPQLMFRAGAGINIHPPDAILQRLIIQLVQLFAGQYLTAVTQPQPCRNGTGGQCVIAGDHFHRNTGGMAFRHRGDGFGARRVH